MKARTAQPTPSPTSRANLTKALDTARATINSGDLYGIILLTIRKGDDTADRGQRVVWGSTENLAKILADFNLAYPELTGAGVMLALSKDEAVEIDANG